MWTIGDKARKAVQFWKPDLLGGKVININLRKIDLNLLTIFDAVMSERHISRAAERLGMSQSAVSHAVNRLRGMLDDPLFVRHANGMEPTRRALDLSTPVREALNDLAGALSPPVGFDALNAKRIFTLAMGDYCECLLMPPLSQWLNKHAPHIQIVCRPVHQNDLIELFHRGEIDLLLDYMPVETKGLVAAPLFQDQLCVTASRHTTKFGDQLSLEEFIATRHVIFGRHSDFGSLLEVALRREGIERQNVMVASSLMTMLLIAARSSLIASVPRRLAQIYADDLDLLIYPLPIDLDQVNVKMYWHQDHHDDAAQIWLRDLVQRTASRL
jgi:DNA-binding transcriptional LysR family regulator